MARETTRASRQGHAEFRTQCENHVNEDGTTGAHCWLCTQQIDYDAEHDDWGNDDRYQLDHYYPVSTHPELQHDPALWRPSHAGCNRDRGNQAPTPPIGQQSRNWLG